MPSDDAEFLAGSSERRQLLAYLSERSGTPADLAEDLPIARRTIQRHLAQLVERGWAEKSDGKYSLTMTGELIITEHQSYRNSLTQISNFDSFFRHLTDTDHTPDPRWLADASITESTRDNPQAPVQAYIQKVQEFDTDRVRMISPVLSRLFHKAHAELALDGTYTELVMSKATIERARSLNPTEFKVVTSVDVLDLFRYPDPIDFGLTLSDDRVLMGAYDDQGQLQACVDAAHPGFLEWADELFQRHRKEATQIEPSFSLPIDFSP